MNPTSKFKNLTASALVKSGSGVLRGCYVNSTTAGTLKFWDSTSETGLVINNTLTPAVGYHNLGDVAFTVGLYVTFGGVADITLYYE